ncbi:MAG: S8 family serine peptidase [Oligoflexia bacterium]|nr:S8 family serine peptidase [Oligoflexia bacterium]
MKGSTKIGANNNIAFLSLLGQLTCLLVCLSIFTLFTSPLAKSTDSVHWNIDSNSAASINIKDAWKSFSKTKDVIIAVVDTGIDFSHPHLQQNILKEKDAKDTDDKKALTMDFSYNATNLHLPNDDHGHGTHVSGIIKSVNPDIKILPLKYYNPIASGVENLKSTIKALRHAILSNVDIINYSGGGPEPSDEELQVLKLAEKKGILVVVAAGNEHSNIDNKSMAYYPASYNLNNIITVAAHDEEQEILPSSNWGPKTVDIFAPGNNIRSSIPHGRAGYMTGTSQSTAFVSGVASLIKSQYPFLLAPEIKKIIINNAKKIKRLSGKCSSGGILDAANTLLKASQYTSGAVKIATAAISSEHKIEHKILNEIKSKK